MFLKLDYWLKYLNWCQAPKRKHKQKFWSVTYQYGNVFVITCHITDRTHLSQHNHPWQKQGRVAGCLWHKRPEPGLDPSHLWGERKKTWARREELKLDEGRLRGRVTAGESERGRPPPPSEMKIRRGMLAAGVCLCVLKGDMRWHRASGSLSVTRRLSSTQTHFSFYNSTVLTRIHWAEARKHLHPDFFQHFHQPDNLKTLTWEEQ